MEGKVRAVFVPMKDSMRGEKGGLGRSMRGDETGGKGGGRVKKIYHDKNIRYAGYYETKGIL